MAFDNSEVRLGILCASIIALYVRRRISVDFRVLKAQVSLLHPDAASLVGCSIPRDDTHFTAQRRLENIDSPSILSLAVGDPHAAEVDIGLGDKEYTTVEASTPTVRDRYLLEKECSLIDIERSVAVILAIDVGESRRVSDCDVGVVNLQVSVPRSTVCIGIE